MYKANDKYNSSLSSGYTAGQNTLSLNAVPTNVPTILVAGKGTANETVFACTGKTVSTVTGVTRLRGANVNLDPGTSITCLNNEDFLNQYDDAISDLETDMAAKFSQVFCGSVTYDISSADPIVITGVGFTPKLLRLKGCLVGSKSTSDGVATATNMETISIDDLGNSHFDSAYVGVIWQAVGSGRNSVLVLTTFGVDGFTLTPAPNAGPTGTGTLQYEVLG